MVTWQMTSRDPKRSRSWPRYLWSWISRQPWEIHGRFILTTNRKPHLGNPVVTWPMTSRDPTVFLFSHSSIFNSMINSQSNFKCFWKDRDRNGGGVCILVNSSIDVIPVAIPKKSVLLKSFLLMWLLNIWKIPLIRSRPWRYINLLIYLLKNRIIALLNAWK